MSEPPATPPHALSATERRWLTAAIALTLILINLPYLLGVLRASDAPFTGVVMATADMYSYFTKMRIGAGGSLLYRNAYAVEPHPATWLFQPYLLLGRLAAGRAGARVAIGRLAWAFHLARIALSVPYLVLLYHIVGLFLTRPHQRRVAWLLAIYGSGLAWIAVLISGNPMVFGGPLELYVGEVTGFLALMTLPHILLARAAMYGGILLLVRAIERGEVWRAGLAGACWLLMTNAVPFYIVSAAGLVGAWMLFRWQQRRTFPLRLMLYGLLAGLPGGAFAALNLVLMAGDPVYASWSAQNSLPLPPALSLLSSFGLQIAIAVPAAVFALRQRMPRADLLVGWALAGPVLMLIPVPYRLRLIEGFFVPLSVLMVIGLHAVLQHTSWLTQRAAAVMLAALLLPSFGLVAGGATVIAANGWEPAVLNADTAHVLEYLRGQSPAGSIVLSAESTGEMLPAAAPVRTVLGHGFETPDHDRKAAEVAAFYGSGMTDAQRINLLNHYSVHYVVLGPAERATAGGEPFSPGQLGLREVYASGGTILYEWVQ